MVYNFGSFKFVKFEFSVEVNYDLLNYAPANTYWIQRLHPCYEICYLFIYLFVLIYKPGETIQCATLFSHGTQVAMFSRKCRAGISVSKTETLYCYCDVLFCKFIAQYFHVVWKVIVLYLEK